MGPLLTGYARRPRRGGALPVGSGGGGVILGELLSADGGMLQGAAVLELGDGTKVATISRSTTATLTGSNLYSG